MSFHAARLECSAFIPHCTSPRSLITPGSIWNVLGLNRRPGADAAVLSSSTPLN
jgi:hypothetical protein